MRYLFLIFCFISAFSFCYSQNIGNFSNDKYNSFSPVDSAKSPAKAVTMSAILPGLGQYYNESYWKIPVIYGLGAFFVYEYVKYDKDYKDYSKKFDASITPVNPYGSYYLKSYLENYRDKRDSFLWYGGFLYLINIVDAFVDAHLYNFDVDENISVGFNPGMSNKTFYLKIKF